VVPITGNERFSKGTKRPGRLRDGEKGVGEIPPGIDLAGAYADLRFQGRVVPRQAVRIR
jgi:hypothetical protein